MAAFYIIPFSIIDTNLDGIITALYSRVLVMLNLNEINKINKVIKILMLLTISNISRQHKKRNSMPLASLDRLHSL